MLKKVYKCVFLSLTASSVLMTINFIDFAVIKHRNTSNYYSKLLSSNINNQYEYDNKNTYTFNVNKKINNYIANTSTFDNGWKAIQYKFWTNPWIPTTDVTCYDFYGWNMKDYYQHNNWLNQSIHQENYKIQYTDIYGTIENCSSIINYSNKILLPNTTFNKDYQLIFNFNSGISIKINSNQFQNNVYKNKQDILTVERYDGDNLKPNTNYGTLGGTFKGDDDNKLGSHNWINERYYDTYNKYYPKIYNYQNNRKDSFVINCDYTINLDGNNIHYDLNFKGISTNEGNQNVYQFQNQTFNLELVNIQVKPLDYNLINETQLQNNLDKIFNTSLSTTVDNDNKLSSNKELIKSLVDERLHEQFKLLGYYYNSSWFNWNIELYNDEKKTITIKFNYKLFYTNANSNLGWNNYNVEVPVIIKSSDKYYATEIWKRFLVGNTKISYDLVKIEQKFKPCIYILFLYQCILFKKI